MPNKYATGYIVVVSPSYGGAEKRFFDIFTSLIRQGAAVKMIAPSSLVDCFKGDHPERADVLANLVPVEMAGEWSRIEFVRRFRHILRDIPPRSTFHYPLNCLWPLHLRRRDRVTMSVADCTSTPKLLSTKRTDVWTWISFFFVDRIDVLSPAVHAELQAHWRHNAISLTPGGTFLVPFIQSQVVRQPTVCFLGRLAEGKGLNAFFNVLPSLWILLKDKAPPNFSFKIAGYGSLENYVKAWTEKLAKEGIPISFIGYAHADELLAQCAVLLSLQDTTNYPSRVVAESLMAGCAVIIRDTGDSRQFGSDVPGLVYCKAELSPEELADQVLMLITRSQSEPNFEESLRKSAQARFSSPLYINYFHELMLGETSV